LENQGKLFFYGVVARTFLIQTRERKCCMCIHNSSRQL